MYIQGTLDYGIGYKKCKDTSLIGYYNSDWSGDEYDMKSTSDYAISFGSDIFSWTFVKQNRVTLSTAEAEYMSYAEATTQAMWLRFVLQLTRLGEGKTKATPIIVITPLQLQ